MRLRDTRLGVAALVGAAIWTIILFGWSFYSQVQLHEKRIEGIEKYLTEQINNAKKEKAPQ